MTRHRARGIPRTPLAALTAVAARRICAAPAAMACSIASPPISLISIRHRAALLFDGGASGFFLFLRGGAGFGGPAGRRRHRSAADQCDQPIDGILTVALLCAVTLRNDDNDAVARQAAAGDASKPFAHLLRQGASAPTGRSEAARRSTPC